MSQAARPLLVVLTGPTGSGKSDLALRLAERLDPVLPLEIISADSALVYRGMDIGTAKPSRAARARVAHHLIDIRDPAHGYSAGEFVHDARGAIAAIHERGRLPLLVGGTMLYLRALREGLALLPRASQALQQALPAGGEGRMARPACRIGASRSAGGSAHPAQRCAAHPAGAGGLSADRRADFALAAAHSRHQGGVSLAALRRIAKLARRVAPAAAVRFQSIACLCGLVDEVRALYARGDLSEQHASMRAVGYRQLWQFCAGRCSLTEASDKAVIATAQLAKRQLTWLRGEQGLTGLTAHDPAAVETLAAAIRAAARAASHAAVT